MVITYDRYCSTHCSCCLIDAVNLSHARRFVKQNSFCYNPVNATTSNCGINLTWKEVIAMTTIIVSLVIGVIAGIIGNYIYDKYIR